MGTHASYPALVLTQNDQRFFFTTIPVEDLFPYCFVAGRGKDPNQGFQRALSESRAEDIARYLSVGTGSIPTNVVLSAQKSANFRYNSRPKTISFDRTKDSFLVLDGQHRLWGYAKSRVKHRVPVAIYEGLSRADEAKLFIDINTNQRGVPAALLLDIKQLAQIEKGREGQLRIIFDGLNDDPKSALRGKLSRAKSIVGKISRVTFNRAVTLLLESDIVATLDEPNTYKLVLNYVNAFEAELSDPKMLVRSAYFEAMFEIADEVLRSTRQTKGDLKQKSIQHVIRLIAKLSFEGRGNLTKKEYAKAMQAALRRSTPVSADML